MKTISIHKIEDKLMALIQKKADEKGLSLNKTIKLLLREALGLSTSPELEKQQSFKEFCGIWQEEDAHHFEKQTKDFQSIDPSDWL